MFDQSSESLQGGFFYVIVFRDLIFKMSDSNEEPNSEFMYLYDERIKRSPQGPTKRNRLKPWLCFPYAIIIIEMI